MLQAAALNGFVVWIYSIINWFRRVYYHMKGAVTIYGELVPGGKEEGPWKFTIDDNGTPKTVTATEPGIGQKVYDYVTEKNEVELLWIPGSKRAMVKRYFDSKTLLICDVVSIVCLVLFIASYAFFISAMSNPLTASPSLLTTVIMISIVGMIACAFIRKKYRK